MPRSFFLQTTLTCIVTLGAGVAQAQPSPAGAGGGVLSGANAAGFPLARASRVAQPPVVDGDVLGDPAYEDAVVAGEFRQTTPDEGQPSSERTEVRIVYTEDTLYFGVVCYTRDPRTIIVADSRRDSQMNDTDSFQIILDTFLDQQNGFVFGTNPAGVEYDGQVTNEGQGSGRMGGGGGGGRQQRGSGGGFNLNWDGAWQVTARVTEIGWTAEFGIPFRTLRYPGGSTQTWGVNFQRNIRNRNERSFWAPLPRQFNLNRLSLAGVLQGLEVPGQGNLKLTPYVLGDAVRSATRSETVSTGDFGVDLKYSVTPGMTLDLTANTDFAQVEVDEEQINLDRFNLFFPRNVRSSWRTPACSRWAGQGRWRSSSAGGSGSARRASRCRSSAAAACRARSATTRTSASSTCRPRARATTSRARTSPWRASGRTCPAARTSGPSWSTGRAPATRPAKATTTARSPWTAASASGNP